MGRFFSLFYFFFICPCQVVRRRIIGKGLRVDGRRLNEVRPLYCEAGHLPVLHGSSIFSRGDTQVGSMITSMFWTLSTEMVAVVGY